MINGKTFKNAIISGSNNICSQKQKINDLNIFPVPDGDTGTNMSMTISAAVNALNDVESNSVGEVAKIVASSMLRGARGNSGVITSLLFKGIAKGLEGIDEASGKDLTYALGLGVDAAYKAVAKPVEGTILTVARMAYEKALEVSEMTEDAVEIWQVVCDEASYALNQTPKMLPVLKKAGVVDAGGKGILTIFEGMLSLLRDAEIISLVEEKEFSVDDEEMDAFRSAAAEFDEVINFTYCTEFIVGRDSNVEKEPSELRMFLETIGDCVVVVDDEEIIKVHVHTENPGMALQEGLQFGQLLTVKVENMKEQHKNAVAENEKKKSTSVEKVPLEEVKPTEEYGIVSVAAGEGITTVFKELGCLHVVSGGQSMNPSTDDIYEAIMATPGKTVYVLPNNKNIIMAATQTIDMVTDRKVVIVPTKTIPQGVSALLAFDGSLDEQINIENMTEAIKCVSTGQITYAARDSEFGMKKIREGEIIGLDNGKLTVTSSTPNKALVKLARQMVNEEMTSITIFTGEGITEEDVEEAQAMLMDKFDGEVEITFIKGDQPIYYYIMSVE